MPVPLPTQRSRPASGVRPMRRPRRAGRGTSCVSSSAVCAAGSSCSTGPAVSSPCARSASRSGVDAIVMAAGEGTRLRPLTERWPKPVLPIDGRPVIGTLLRELHAAGITNAVVVTGHLAEQVEALVGDGTAFGVDVRYARQPEPDGSADAVRR